MTGSPFRRTLRATALAQVHHVEPVRFGAAPRLVAEVYGGLERDFGVLAPPIALHSPAPELLAASWMMLRESMIANGLVDRPTKEAVAAAVSLANDCPYCVTVHSAILNRLVHGRDAAAIADDRFGEIADPEVRAVADWARAAAFRDVAVRYEHPFPAGQVPELIGVAVAFHYLNRMVNVFLPDVPMPSRSPRMSLPVVTRVLSILIRSASRPVRAAGTSLDLLPDAPLPPDMMWASGNPAVAGAFARAARAVDEAGRRSVPASVRERLHSVLGDWDGRPLGLDRAWLTPILGDLPDADRPAGRLALLTAVASWQIDQSAVDDFRRTASADKTLVELTSWAALTAARHIGAWTPPTSPGGSIHRPGQAGNRTDHGEQRVGTQRGLEPGGEPVR